MWHHQLDRIDYVGVTGINRNNTKWTLVVRVNPRIGPVRSEMAAPHQFEMAGGFGID
jgi:hypothetical protein